MRITIKLSGDFAQYDLGGQTEAGGITLDGPVPVKKVLDVFNIPDDRPKLILVNGRVKNKHEMLKDGDILSIFPVMAGG